MKFWNRLPVILQAVIAGSLVNLFGTLPWPVLYGANLALSPSIPWAVPVMAIYLWFFWRYLQGKGWPSSTAETRRRNLRARALSSRVWGLSLLAGSLAVASLFALYLVYERLIALPQQPFPDVSAYPFLTVFLMLLMASVVAGVVEEAAFRGYMQTPIEQRHGPVAAILVVVACFALAHLAKPSVTLALLPLYFVAAAIYGVLAYLTKSILPGIVLHALQDAYLYFTAWWKGPRATPQLVWETGIDGAFWRSCLTLLMFSIVTVWTYRKVAATMQKKSLGLAIIVFLILGEIAAAQSPRLDHLHKEFDLSGAHSQQAQYFMMESKLITYALDGKRLGTDIYRLHLKCVPAKLAKRDGDEYTCSRFTVQQGEMAEVVIPALANWTYIFKNTGQDEKGQVFGIDHGKFENLVDASGKALPIDKAYHVYNAFIDFHAFCNVFAEPTTAGNGIQNLKKIGQKIVHAAAFSEPPVNLGNNIAAGSSFKNGEITLEFKGVSVVNGRPCALLEYDSGESSFKMLMKPMPDMEVRTTGSSHYFGDIYKDLATQWVQKVTMTELVVSETILPMPPNKINSVIERNIMIRNVSESEFVAKRK